METRLKAVRHARGWSQTRLVVALERACERQGLPPPSRASMKVQVSRWENGHVRPDAMYAALLASVYRTTPADLGLEVTGPTLWLPPPSASGAISREYVSTMQALLGQYARADNVVGPTHLLGVISQHVAHLDSLAAAAGDGLMNEALALCSQFAEFAGWLSQDAGDLMEAERWTDRALDYLAAGDDPSARAYVLMRKSAIAADRNDRVRSAQLAKAASCGSDRMDPATHALVLRQTAISCALTGDAKESDRAAHAALTVSSDHDPSGLHAYCTRSYLLMETGVAAMRLRHYDVAADRLSRAAAAWPEGYPRDQGLCLARLALVEAMRGNVDVACEVARTAVDVSAVAGSARTRAAFLTLERRLAPHQGATVVAEFQEYYAAKLG